MSLSLASFRIADMTLEKGESDRDKIGAVAQVLLYGVWFYDRVTQEGLEW
jgi:hypothetical protein